MADILDALFDLYTPVSLTEPVIRFAYAEGLSQMEHLVTSHTLTWAAGDSDAFEVWLSDKPDRFKADLSAMTVRTGKTMLKRSHVVSFYVDLARGLNPKEFEAGVA